VAVILKAAVCLNDEIVNYQLVYRFGLQMAVMPPRQRHRGINSSRCRWSWIVMLQCASMTRSWTYQLVYRWLHLDNAATSKTSRNHQSVVARLLFRFPGPEVLEYRLGFTCLFVNENQSTRGVSELKAW